MELRPAYDPDGSVFEDLSVFSGSFGLTEAEQVCTDQDDVLDCLIDLVEQSLLRQTETSGDPRFRMLTVIRDFGYAALVARGDEQAVWRGTPSSTWVLPKRQGRRSSPRGS